MMISVRTPRFVPATCAAPRPLRSVTARAINAPRSKRDNEDKHINPKTGNPQVGRVRAGIGKRAFVAGDSPAHQNPHMHMQTGQLIDVYFEIGSAAVVVLLAFWSLWNVRGVLNQVGAADKMREPASKTEWMAHDTKNVRVRRPPNLEHGAQVGGRNPQLASTPLSTPSTLHPLTPTLDPTGVRPVRRRLNAHRRDAGHARRPPVPHRRVQPPTALVAALRDARMVGQEAAICGCL